jgi:WD40 repeat protein
VATSFSLAGPEPELTRPRLLKSITTPAGRLHLHYSPDGKTLVTDGVGRVARILDIKNGEILATVDGHID